MKLRSQEEIMAKWPINAKPLVSIRCTAFNQEKFISQCLEGFLIQDTNFPFEICVHDDASTDKTADIIRLFEVKYPKLFKTIYEEENQWSKKDNSFSQIVTSLLTSKYVAMCEGDDYWTDPHKLQTQIEFLENNPKYSLVFHDAEIKNEIGVAENNSVFPPLEDRDYNAQEVFERWTIPTASMVYKRSVLDYPIKKASNILNGDIFLAEKCAHMGKIRCINKKMSVYRRQPGGVTWDASLKIQRLKKYPNHYKELKRNFPLINRRVINRHICGAFVNAWDYVGFTTKISFFFQGIILAPRTFLRKLLKKIIGTKPQFSFLG